MYIYRIAIFSAIILSSLCVKAQDEVLQSSELVEAEFHTAVNPTDNNNIVLVSMTGFTDGMDLSLVVYFTKDFGETWTKSDFQGLYPGFIGSGDPVISFNNNGDLSLAHLLVNEEEEILTALSSSSDFGETWQLEYLYSQDSDKPWTTIDKSLSSPYESNIYLTTVTDYVELLCFDEDYTLIHEQSLPNGDHFPCVVTNQSGDVFASSGDWADPVNLYISKYSSGGATLEHSTFITSIPDFIFNADEISSRFNPNVYLAIDNSDGPYSGRLYLAYTGSEDVNPEYFNIFLTYSDDDGLTWSTPKIVHSDTTGEVQQFYSSIYVNDNGVLLLDWYDRTNYDSTTLNTDFFLGISNDGGENFTELKLNSQPMDFAITVEAGLGFGIGDYHQLVATNSTAISFWSDGRTNDGDLDIYFSKVNLENPFVGVTQQSLINDKISVINIYPQPVNDQINFSLQLEDVNNLTFNILSLDGKLVKEGSSTQYTSGVHEVQIPISLSPGQYILQVTSDKGYFNNQKFLVVK